MRDDTPAEASIAFVLLCHKDPDAVIAQASRLVAAGACVAIHFDRNAPEAQFARIRAALDGTPGIAFAPRIRCGWGDWSLVEATLGGVRTALAAFPGATHLYLISGDCLPVKPAAHIRAALAPADRDHIESVDFFESGWIKTGPRDERLIYRHYFNERTQKRLFYGTLGLQARLGLRRRLPKGLEMRVGSQWWCLRRATVEAVLEFLHRRPDVVRFFRRTWIPDETLFQTLVPHLVPEAEIVARPPTFLLFSDYGIPVTFHDDQGDLILRQPAFFARKVSPEATALRQRLAEVFAGRAEAPAISDDGAALHAYLTSRGRTGVRFAESAWERGGTVGLDREVLVVVAKKWHVGRRLAEAFGRATNLPALGYVFDEEDAGLPPLGGLERPFGKRLRHRRAFLNLLLGHFGGQRLLFCADPSNLDLLADIARDACDLKVLEVECGMSDAFLAGHTVRVGLATDATPPEAVAALLPGLRSDLRGEVERLRAADLPGYARISEAQGPRRMAPVLASFFGIAEDKAAAIAADPTLFAD